MATRSLALPLTAIRLNVAVVINSMRAFMFVTPATLAVQRRCHNVNARCNIQTANIKVQTELSQSNATRLVHSTLALHFALCILNRVPPSLLSLENPAHRTDEFL